MVADGEAFEGGGPAALLRTFGLPLVGSSLFWGVFGDTGLCVRGVVHTEHTVF